MPDAQDQSLLEVDSRRRLSLGGLATHDRYLAAVEEDGTIVLTPVVVVPVAQMRLNGAAETMRDVDEFLDAPETGTVRSRPSRKRQR